MKSIKSPVKKVVKKVRKEPETMVDVTEFKGSQIFGIYDEDKYKADPDDQGAAIIRFGLRKARAILMHIEELKEFVENNSEE